MLNKVLLIDDSVTIHRVIDLSIDLERLSLVKVFNKKDAEEKLQSDKFDYILLDNKLDEIRVNIFIKELKNKYPSTKLILLVGAFDKFTGQDLINTGADDFLVKPFDSETLNLKLSDTTEVVTDIPTPIYFPEDNIDNIGDVDGIDLLDSNGEDITGISDIDNIGDIDGIDLLEGDKDLISHKDISDIDDIDFSAIDDEFAIGDDDIDFLDIKSDLLDEVSEGIDTNIDIDSNIDTDLDFSTDIGSDTNLDISTDLDADLFPDITTHDDELDEIDHIMGDLNNDLLGTDEKLHNDNTSYTNISDDAFKDIDLLLGDFDEGFGVGDDNIGSEKSSDEAVNSDDLMNRVAFISEDKDIDDDLPTGTDSNSDDPILDDINEQLDSIDDLDINTLSTISEIEKDINDVVIDSDESVSSDVSLEPKDIDLDFNLDDVDVSAIQVESVEDIHVANIDHISDLHDESGMDIKETDVHVADIEDLHDESGLDIKETEVHVADIEDLHDESGLHTDPAVNIENDVNNLSEAVSSTLYDEVIVPTLNEYEKRFDSIQSRNAKKKTYEDSLLDTEEISFIDDKTQPETSADINFNISKDEIYSILANSLSKKFLQESIKDILSEHIKELVRDVIPDIAEKYIKEEIERLKSDV